MNVFYKYYSYLKPEYFSEPNIKISQPYLLNDPFEQFLSQDAIDAILKEFIENEPPEEMTEDIISSLKNTFLNWKGSTGIVSLSETHRNILMWSHYSNSHRGLCVGYKKDFLSSLPPFKNTRDRSRYAPVKVNYDICRFDIEKYERDQPTFIDIAESSLITKSDDWIYEKEHRCIIPFAWADKVVISGDVQSIPAIQCDWMFEDDNIKERRKVEYNGKTGEEISFNDDVSYMYALLLKEPNALILKNISPSSIAEIYFGCQTESNYIDAITSEIQKNKKTLGHIKLYKYQACKTKFDLIATKIDI